jgi:hypothetical protein
VDQLLGILSIGEWDILPMETILACIVVSKLFCLLARLFELVWERCQVQIRGNSSLMDLVRMQMASSLNLTMESSQRWYISRYIMLIYQGLWLMPEPEGAQVFMFTFPREEDLEALVDIIRPLRIQQVIANFPHLRHVLQEAAVYGNKASYYDGPGAIPDDKIDEISSKLWMGKCRWLYYGCVYGDEAFRNAQLNNIKKAFFKIPGAKFFLPEDSPEYSYLRSRVNIYCGRPDLRELEYAPLPLISLPGL